MHFAFLTQNDVDLSNPDLLLRVSFRLFFVFDLNPAIGLVLHSLETLKPVSLNGQQPTQQASLSSNELRRKMLSELTIGV